MIYLSEFEYYGFKIEEIGPMLIEHGIDIGLFELGNANQSKPADSWPSWKRTLSLHAYLTLQEIAAAFADIDLHAPGWLSDDEGAELRRWTETIKRAVIASEIEPDPSSYKWDAQGEFESVDISPDELQRWCNKKGLGYPLPGAVSLPQTDSGLREALSNAEAERAKLKVKVAELEAIGDQRTQLLAEIEIMRNEATRRAEEIAAIRAERDKLKSEVLKGKSKNTAAKIIGGILKEAYRLDIHADRIDRISEIRNDIQKAGANVDEKPLRTWIREAANVIDKNIKQR